MTKVLITGHAGFIGSNLADHLLETGMDVWGIDDYSSGNVTNLADAEKSNAYHVWEQQSNLSLDVAHHSAMALRVNAIKPDVIVHLAAQPSLISSQKDPCNDAYQNIIGTIRVLEAAARCHVPHVIFASTSAVYQSIEDGEYHEVDIVNPSTPYGLSKATAEYYIRLLRPNHHTILRFANVYGPRQRPLGENQLIPRIIQHFRKGEPFSIYGDGEQTRDMIYVDDISRAIRACIVRKQSRGKTMNLGRGVGHSVGVIARSVAEIMVDDWNYDFAHSENRDDRKHVVLNSMYAREILDWRPLTSLDAGLNRTIDWWKQQ